MPNLLFTFGSSGLKLIPVYVVIQFPPIILNLLFKTNKVIQRRLKGNLRVLNGFLWFNSNKLLKDSLNGFYGVIR